MAIKDRLKQSVETNKLNEVLNGRYPALERYKLREFFSLGFPEMYLLAKNPLYEIVYPSYQSQVTSHIISTCDKKDYFISGVKTYMRDENLAEEMFPGKVEKFNFFEEVVRLISSCYSETMQEQLAGLAYNTYANIKNELLDKDTLYYMLDVLNRNVNLWKSDDLLKIKVNQVKTLGDIISKPYETFNIKRISVEEETGDLLDVKVAVENRVSELSQVLAYLTNRELRRKERLKSKEELSQLKNEVDKTKDWIEMVLKGTASYLEFIAKEYRTLGDFEKLRELDFLERYRGGKEYLENAGIKLNTMIDLVISKRKLDEELFRTTANGDKESKNIVNMGKVKIKFEEELKIETLKLKYIERLINSGQTSRMSYFENMM